MNEFDPHRQQAPPPIDDERMAALLDGRLDEAARTEMVARLAGSEPDYRVFADAAAVLRDLEARPEPLPEPAEVDETPFAPAPAPTPVIKLRRRWWGMPAPAWGAIAAAVAALALIPAIRARGGDPYDPARLASRMETASRPRGGDWTAADVVFPRTRGGGTPDLPDAGRSARLGALLVDLEVAVRSGDTTATPMTAGHVKLLLDDMGVGGTVSPTYDSIANARGRQAIERAIALQQDGREGVAAVSDPDYFGAGAWTEAARLAALTRDARFFRNRESRKGLQRILVTRSLPTEQRDAARRVQGSIPETGEPNWPALQEELCSLLYKLVRTTGPDDVITSPPPGSCNQAAESDV